MPAPETPEKIDSYLRFTDTSLQVEATHSAVYVNIEWSAVEWELKANAGDIVEALSVTSGGDKTKAYQKTRVRLTHHANLTAESRTQTLTLTNKETNETATLTVTQAAGYKAASVT